MSGLFILVYIAMIILGWYLNRLFVNEVSYVASFAVFLGGIVVANQYVQESALAVHLAFAVTLLAFGYIMSGHKKKR